MLRLSKKTLLALEAVVDVAYNARPDPVQSKEITQRQGIPQRYLEQVMQQLVREGVLKGVRGPRGGYRLARERRRITVGDVVRIVGALEAADEAKASGGATNGGAANGGDNTGGSPLGSEVVRPMWEQFQAEMMEKLDAVTIDELCRQAEEKGIRPATPERADFTI